MIRRECRVDQLGESGLMKNNRRKVPEMTPLKLTIYILVLIAIGLFFFFIQGDMPGKICACTVCPAMVVYLIYAYHKEKSADRSFVDKNENIISGNYFKTAEWQHNYITYRNKYPFEKAMYPDMKKDLLSRFRRREYVVWMLFMAFLMFGSCCLMMQKRFLGLIGFLLFGILFCLDFSLYIGTPVRKWLKRDIDYDALEKSYINARFIVYKKNGFAFGTTHIHAYTEKKVYAIDYRLVEGISRKVVRYKKYEDGIYSSEEYKHYAVIHVRLPQSGQIHNVEIELNEFQVQMAIDYLPVFRFGENLKEDISMELVKDNIVV